MNRTLKHTLALLSSLLSMSAVAASPDYRVDVLVFSHLEGEAETRETAELRSFAALPRLDDVPRPDGLQAVTDMSAPMESIWRRFRRSAGYRPLLYVSWVQSTIEYTPPLRVHDTTVLTESLQFPADTVIADLTADDPLAVYRVPFYQLDGTVQLRLSRFLHLDLDLEFREILPPNMSVDIPNDIPGEIPSEPPQANNNVPVFATTDSDDAGFDAGFDHGGREPAPNYAIRALRQSRQVRTGEMQYFDSPFIGVIAHVTEISPTDTPSTQ